MQILNLHYENIFQYSNLTAIKHVFKKKSLVDNFNK